jgi:hypothetical protein
MTRGWLARRLTHTCTIERDSGTAQSSTGEPQESWSAVGSGVACRFAAKQERLASEQIGFVTRQVNLLLLKSDQDVQIEDRVHSITDANGSVVAAGTYAIEQLLTRRDIRGKKHHQSAELERVVFG